ncbi:hypothetical protein ACFSQJ_08750 [Croceitalea marina]|uniref:Uncharacterized protein n=1 Tax=Croceitalea marina TaxID=1775166 RepID=A0ABW5MXZ1_9FLAO
MKPVNIQKTLLVCFLFFGVNGFCQDSYFPNTTLRSQIRKTVWKELKEQTPQKYRFMTGLIFNSNNSFGLYEDAAKKYGWKPYELPTVVAFYDIVLRETVSATTFTEEKVEEIYEKTKSDYAKGRIDAGLSSSRKQEKYDAMIVRALWVATVFELSKKKSTEVQKIAASLLRKSGEFTSEPSEVDDNTVVKEINTTPPTVKKPSPNGNTTEKVNDIILRTATKYCLNGVYVANDVSVLYNNGDIFTNPSEPLNGLNIAESKRKNPKKWQRWKKQGNILYVTDPRKRKTYDWKKWFKVRSASKSFKLSGRYNTSDGFGGATVINASTVVFDQQGRFAWKTIKGGNTDWKPIFSKSTSAGTYEIDGYTITLKYNNGVEEAFFFGLYPKDNEHFVIGSSHFAPTKN